MNKFMRMTIIVIAVISIAGCLSTRSTFVSGTALLIPHRYTMVELAFNIRNFRPVQLLIFDVKKSTLYIWNSGERKWIKTNAADVHRIPEVELNKIIAIGTEQDIPQSCLDSLKIPGVSIVRIDSLDFKTVFNELNRHFNFSLSEWEYFAKNYGLTIEDRNAERRRWGKYGKPGSSKPLGQLQPVVMPEEISGKPEQTGKTPVVISPPEKPAAISTQENTRQEHRIFIPPADRAKEGVPAKEVKKTEPADK